MEPERLRTVTFGAVYDVEWVRHAWGHPWGCDLATCLSFTDAVRSAERERKDLQWRGTHFTIRECPALVLVGEANGLLVYDLRRACLRNIELPREIPTTLDDIAAALEKSSLGRLAIAMHPLPLLPLRNKPRWYQYEGRQRSSGREPLAWEKKPLSQRVSALVQARDTWNRHVGQQAAEQ